MDAADRRLLDAALQQTSALERRLNHDAPRARAASRSSASSPRPPPATAEKEEREARMKTTRQLKEIFDGAGLEYSGLDKEGLQKLAYKNYDALKDKLERKRRPSSGGGGGGGFGGGIPGMENMKAPDGMDQDKWEDMLAQMRGDFSREKDPERRRILEKLKRKGMSFGGGNDMDIEQLRNMEKMMDGLGSGGFGGAGGAGARVPETRTEPSPGDEDIADEDKLEL